jgi:hypothetical protein
MPVTISIGRLLNLSYSAMLKIFELRLDIPHFCSPSTMAKVASQTVRVTDISLDVDEKDFHEYAQHLSSKNVNRGMFSSTTHGSPNPRVTFTPQFDGHVGTITLPSEKHKLAAMRDNNTQWRLDDVFHGVTVLSCPEEPDLEYVSPSLKNKNAKRKF